MLSILITINFDVSTLLLSLDWLGQTHSEIQAESFSECFYPGEDISERLASFFLTIKVARTFWQNYIS
jgi:hypothetical protein